jgi:4-hydroxy-3-polyprenylbenzoate decarboxylase
MSKPYKDLREWLQGVEALGGLKKIEGADWRLEMGAITELLGQEGKYPPPAILFDSIPGFPRGFRTLFGTTGSVQRMALTLGLSDVRSGTDLVKAYREKSINLKPIPPKVVDTGPIFENIQSGKISISSSSLFLSCTKRTGDGTSGPTAWSLPNIRTKDG